jgi:hypothetical protein
MDRILHVDGLLDPWLVTTPSEGSPADQRRIDALIDAEVGELVLQCQREHVTSLDDLSEWYSMTDGKQAPSELIALLDARVSGRIDRSISSGAAVHIQSSGFGYFV